jgi:hypothetical protein
MEYSYEIPAFACDIATKIELTKDGPEERDSFTNDNDKVPVTVGSLV